MGHFIFILFHAAALLFGFWALIVTVPLHLIYAAVSSSSDKAPPKPKPATHVKCPDCAEFVLNEARVCKHCGCRLIPQSEVNQQQQPENEFSVMELYGITTNGRNYQYQGYSYDHLKDAVAYAKKQTGK